MIKSQVSFIVWHCYVYRDIGGENFADFSTKFGEPTNEPFGAPESDAGDIPTNHPTADMRRVMLPTVTAPKPHTAHQFSIRYVMS